MLPMAKNFLKVQEMTWVPSCEKTSRVGGRGFTEWKSLTQEREKKRRHISRAMDRSEHCIGQGVRDGKGREGVWEKDRPGATFLLLNFMRSHTTYTYIKDASFSYRQEPLWALSKKPMQLQMYNTSCMYTVGEGVCILIKPVSSFS